jgi:hypothetical protein
MRFCTYCGFALTGAPSYCGGCGAPIDQALGSEPPPAATSPMVAPPVPPTGQGPPDPWGRQTAPDPWHQDPSDPWPYQGAPGPPAHQETHGAWPPQMAPGPPAHQDAPYPWGRQTAPGPWPRQEPLGSPPSPGTLDAPPRQNAPGSRTRERPAGLPAAPDPFGGTFAADRPQTAAMTELLPAVGLLGDEARLPRATPRRGPRPASQGVLILAVLATLASLATGGLGAWWISSHHAGLRSTSAGGRSRSPSASSPVAPEPTAANDAVAIAPAVAGKPAAHRVAALLKAYFGSINSRDYSTYSLLFIPEIRESVDHFNAGYRSTTDSGATLVGLTSAGAQDLAATVTFTSRQNPADSPDHATCDRWNVVLTLTGTGTGAGTGYLIARSPAGYHPTVHSCR